MLLFIASEIMLFGAFFTAYFFVRVVNGIEWPQPPFELPVFVAGVNTAILVTSSFTMHWALQSIKRGNRAGLQAGLLLTFLMGLVFLLTQAREYSRVGFAPAQRRVRDDLLLPHRPAWRARLRRPLDPPVHDDPGLPRPFLPGAPSRCRDRRDLLALRGRNVDCRVLDRLPPLTHDQSAPQRGRGVQVPDRFDRLLRSDRRSPRSTGGNWVGLGVFVALTRRGRRLVAARTAGRAPARRRRLARMRRGRAAHPRDRERDRRRPHSALDDPREEPRRPRGGARRHAGAELAAQALGLGRGRCARRRRRSGSTEASRNSPKRASRHAARSATAILSRRSRTRCGRSARTRSSSRRTRRAARTGSSAASSRRRASASRSRSRTSSSISTR